jgi:hypothetical protein
MDMKPYNLKSKIYITLLIILTFVVLPGCDLVDASKVTNPQIVDDNLRANATGGTSAVVAGVRRQLAVVEGIQSLVGDLVSDNLDNRASFYDNTLNFPRIITPTSFTYDASYLGLLTLNALADFGLTAIIPADKNATSDQIAEVHFYKGMALLLLGENYSKFPVVENGPAVSGNEAIALAVTEFNTALPLIGPASAATQAMRANCYLGLARAYRMLGNKASALGAANSALGVAASGTFTGGATYVFNAAEDAANGPTSTLLAALVTRASNDIQPNPRLDFLDPKLTLNTQPMPVMKAEEAHLILAEIALANGDLPGARTSMTNAVTLALSRTKTSFKDNDTRTGRPNNSTMTVFTDDGHTYAAISGLIVARSGATINVPTISGTSQTAATIAALATLPTGSGPKTQRFEHIRLLYLLRQEIFFGEGRRMTDLGIRLPVPKRQLDGNPNIGGTGGEVVVVPNYIPPSDEWRSFSVSGTVVTIKWDLNKEIATNINTVSPLAPIP